ncbi:MAG: transcription termination factor Rho, partial [Acidimicrobiia bacterium]|nr:transcription termination factor Rho [Acidimicrobiia bacterium]
RSDRADRSERNDRAERSDRADRSERNDRAERSDRADRSERDDRADRNDRREGRGGGSDHPNGPETEPPADWELMLDAQGGTGGQGAGRPDQGEGGQGDDVDPGNRRNRRRGRGRGRERDEVVFEPISAEPIPVAGVLDLRDEGYGFLRVDGCLPSKDDVYVSVKQVRQFGLRKGDVLTGLSRPANRNEKNPGFHEIHTVNDLPVEEGRYRVRFDDMTPLFPDQRLRLEMRDEPLNMSTRIIDLVAPIGKGQRALIVSPPKAGKTSIIKDIARAIETNNPEVRLIVLLLDERPEEVTDMSRHLTRGDVVASTFDRPPEEHCAVAELTIERAKRLVEAGEDVVMIVDGITRLARAYNLTVPPTGRSMSGGVDAGALYPPKRFFGAARNLEEGGSLTIVATALVETGSRMDEVIFEEFKGTGNCEIRLDRRLADKRLYPAIDIDASSTRHEELLFDRQEQLVAWKLRRVLSAMKADDGSFGPAVEMLIDRLKSFRTNADFLNEIAKGPSL